MRTGRAGSRGEAEFGAAQLAEALNDRLEEAWRLAGPGDRAGEDGTDLASIDPPRRAARTRNRAGKSGTALLTGAGG